MSQAERARDQLLERVGERAEAVVVVETGVSELTRFANSYIHQNVGEKVSEISVTVSADGRTSKLTGSSLSDEGLARLVEQAMDMVRVAPVDQDWPGVIGPTEVPDVDSRSADVVSITPDSRANAIKEFLAVSEGLNGAGYCETVAIERAVGTSAGQKAVGAKTSTVFDAILRTDTSSGSAHHASQNWASLDPTALGQLALDRARRGENPVTVDAGVYEVVFSHDVMAEIALEVGVYGFSGNAIRNEQTFVKPGAMQFDPSITLVDDPLSPGGLSFGFDAEGTPRERVDLVRAGVSGTGCFSRKVAKQTGNQPNGYAATGDIGQYFGGGPSDIVMTGGSHTEQELIGAVERGIYVSTFNYCRCLDPMTVEVTGLTRNGTFLIEDGELTKALTNLRFTQSYVDALGQGNVLGLSNDPRYGMADLGPGYVRAPAARLAGWNFTGNADG